MAGPLFILQIWAWDRITTVSLTLSNRELQEDGLEHMYAIATNPTTGSMTAICDLIQPVSFCMMEERRQTQLPAPHQAPAAPPSTANPVDPPIPESVSSGSRGRSRGHARGRRRDQVQAAQGGKSSVLMDVKPWDDETDMKKLEEAVRSVEMPGLLWGASKLVPVCYGIKKLQIMLTIVDDLVSVDDLIEEHLTAEPCNEYVQSCDIVAFNKI
ncbi:elongation factor 1-beta-like [Manihot esculenta]|nr:elongation factor 1-beta-like [Manihot esculenta]